MADGKPTDIFIIEHSTLRGDPTADNWVQPIIGFGLIENFQKAYQSKTYIGSVT